MALIRALVRDGSERQMAALMSISKILGDTAKRACILLLAAFPGFCAAGAARAGGPAREVATVAPRITTVAGLHGAVIVTLSSRTPRAQVYYTVDGTTPTLRSTPYEAPFLISSNLTVRAVAQSSGHPMSRVKTRKFHLNVPAGAVVWSDEFNGAARGGRNARPDAQLWNYATGAD